MSLKYFEVFANTTREYVENSSIPGHKYLIRRNGFERSIWWTMNVVLFAATTWMIKYIADGFLAAPTVTWQSSITNPIDLVPFPSIAVCDINKISRVKAINFSKQLSNISAIKESQILKYVGLSGKMYDYSFNAGDEDQLVAFQTLLETHYWGPEQKFNMAELLEKFTMSCDELMSDCYWMNFKVGCAELFAEELTADGKCCVFNHRPAKTTSIRPNLWAANHYRPLRVKRPGRETGLSVKIYSNESDSMYTILAMTGFKVMIFNPEYFPDPYSGSVKEMILAPGREADILLNFQTLKTSTEVKKYPVAARNCWFFDEQPTIFGKYDYSDCLTECRVKSVVALCQCVPFQFRFLVDNFTVPQCTLSDLVCLSKYKGKWSTIFPNFSDELLQRERQDSLNCPNCLPSCSNTMYYISQSLGYLPVSSKPSANFSILNAYFEGPFGAFLKRDVIFYWFDIIGIFGGICGLIMGISVISVIELIYLVVVRYYVNLSKTVTTSPTPGEVTLVKFDEAPRRR